MKLCKQKRGLGLSPNQARDMSDGAIVNPASLLQSTLAQLYACRRSHEVNDGSHYRRGGPAIQLALLAYHVVQAHR